MKNKMFKTLINGLVLGAVLTIGYIAGSTLPTQATSQLEWAQIEQAEHLGENCVNVTYPRLTPAEVDAIEQAKTSDYMGDTVPQDTYSKLMRVVDCQYNDNDNDNDTVCVILQDCLGFTYHYDTQNGDIWEGEYYTAILDNNNTEYIMDDIVLKIKYERVDLLMRATEYLDDTSEMQKKNF